MLEEKFKNSAHQLVSGLLVRDRPARDVQIREYKLNLNYFKGFQRLFYDKVIGDYQNVDVVSDAILNSVGVNRNDLGRVINITRAHGESIIAALSTALPVVHFNPMDAENGDDIQTAETYSKASDLVDKHNDSLLLFTYGLFILWNQSFLAAYNYNASDEEYGKYPVPQYGKREDTVQNLSCPSCGGTISESNVPADQVLSNEPVESECPDCGPVMSNPTYNKVVSLEALPPKFYPKNRECIEFYGPLNVRVPINVKCLKDSPYLVLEKEIHYAKLREMYPDSYKEIIPTGSKDIYDRWARAPISWVEDYQSDYVTHRLAWVRPWTYNVLEKDDEFRKHLEKKYPDGVKFCFVNDILVDCKPEILDDHWTITESPLSEYIHGDPIVRPIIEIQNTTNDLVSLTEETCRQSIPDTFVDPDVLDFDAYSKGAKQPGRLIPARPKAGRNLDQSFFTTRTASLSQEVELYRESLERYAQFLLGDFPSVFGGPQDSGKTLGEYEQSKAQALQRLSTIWKMLCSFWGKVKQKATKSYIQNLRYDEKYVKQMGRSFINVWIRRSEALGEIGEVTTEVSEQFPVSWSQKRGLYLQLIGMNKPQFDAAAFSPENLQFTSEMLQMEGFHIPGTEDRNRQLSQIAEMLKTGPIMPQMPPMDMENPMENQMEGGMEEPGEMMGGGPLPPMPGAVPPQMMPPPQPQPSIPIDPLIDNMPICIATIKAWAVSLEGQDAKANNPQGYANVMAQLQQRTGFMQQQMMQQAAQQAAMSPQNGNGKPPQGPPPNRPNGAVERPDLNPPSAGV